MRYTPVLLSAFAVCAANVLIFFAASQVRGGIAPGPWKGYYASTETWHRILVAGCVYALIIGPYTYAFVLHATSASTAQAVMGALMVLGLAVAVGGKGMTPLLAAATLAVALSSVLLGWAVTTAPVRPAVPGLPIGRGAGAESAIPDNAPIPSTTSPRGQTTEKE